MFLNKNALRYQYLTDILGVDENDLDNQVDQVFVAKLSNVKLLVIALAQFVDNGLLDPNLDNMISSSHFDNQPVNSYEFASHQNQILFPSLVSLQEKGLADVIEIEPTSFVMMQWDAREMMVVADYYVVLQSHFSEYINAYQSHLGMRGNPAICNDGHISSSGSLNNYETKMGKKWQQSYGIESDRGVCTKHDGVKEMISLSKYKKMKPKAVKQFDPDFEGDDDLVTYRSSRQPSFSKAQQIAKAKKEKAKAKKAKAKAKKNPMVSASDWMQWANGYGLDYTVDDYMDEGVGELLIHFDADQDVDGTIMSESIAMGGSITGGYHTGGQMTIHTDVYVDA